MSMFSLAICAPLLCCLLVCNAAGPHPSVSPRRRLILTQPMALTSAKLLMASQNTNPTLSPPGEVRAIVRRRERESGRVVESRGVVDGAAFLCETIAAGNHYPGQLDLPTALGPETRATREQFVRFDANAAVPYPVDFGCATSWSKLWGASRCGLMHPHHEDSDRFVWRRASDVALEIAAYAYDDGVRPYSPDNPNLLQPFATRLAVGAVYRLGLEVAPASTLYTLRDVNGTTIENKTVYHANACVDAATGYKLGLYFGGSCAAPYAVTVCYSPSNGWPQGVSAAFVLLGIVCLASCVWGAVWCHRRRRRRRRRRLDGGKSRAEGHVLALQPS